MAGFPPFPLPRSKYTTNHWFYLPKSLTRRNAVSVFASSAMTAFLLGRYLRWKSVSMPLCSTLMLELEMWSLLSIRMRRRLLSSLSDFNAIWMDEINTEL